MSNGEHPIMLRITINRQSQLITTKKSALAEQWNEKTQMVTKSHSDQQTTNILLKSITAQIDLFLLNAGTQHLVVTFEDIKKIVLQLTNVQREIKATTLFVYFEAEIARLKDAERLGYAGTYDSTMKCIKRFTNGRDYPFTGITLDFLRKYEAYLIKRGNALTTRSVFFRTFRTLWKSAITDKVCPENHYPFKQFAFSKYNNPRTKKRAISKTQLNLIINAEIDADEPTKHLSRKYFLFMFYCRGLNFTDLASLKWENIIDGELHYIRAKTKEEFQFKLHPAALEILDYFKTMKGNSDAGYIFPILYKRHNTPTAIRNRKQKVLKMVNDDIKAIASSVGIEKNVTTYVARHSYATILRASGISKEVIGQSLGHNDLKTTDIYLDDIGDPLMDELINAALV